MEEYEIRGIFGSIKFNGFVLEMSGNEKKKKRRKIVIYFFLDDIIVENMEVFKK